MSHTFFS